MSSSHFYQFVLLLVRIAISPYCSQSVLLSDGIAISLFCYRSVLLSVHIAISPYCYQSVLLSVRIVISPYYYQSDMRNCVCCTANLRKTQLLFEKFAVIFDELYVVCSSIVLLVILLLFKVLFYRWRPIK